MPSSSFSPMAQDSLNIARDKPAAPKARLNSIASCPTSDSTTASALPRRSASSASEKSVVPKGTYISPTSSPPASAM